MPLADGEIDGAGGARHERDRGGLVALAEDAERAMPPLEAEVLDVGSARFGDPESVQPEQHRQCGVGSIETLGGEQERAELGTVHAVALARLDLGAPDVLGRV